MPDAPDTPAAPAPMLSRLEAQRGLRISIWEGVWATVFNVLTGGAFLTGFALYLHATPFVMGLMAGLPAVVGLLQLPASLWAQRGGSRRSIVATGAILGRGMFLPILLVPFLLPPASALRLTLFLVLLTLSAAFVTITAPAWTSWMSDLVPASSRGQYFGRRNMIAGIVSLIAPLPAGAFLDHFVKSGALSPPVGFGLLFAIGVAAAAASFFLLLRQPEPLSTSASALERSDGEGKQSASGGGLGALLLPLADPNFRQFLLYAAIIAFALNIANQFFTVWQLDAKGLALPYLTVQAVGAVAAGAGLLAMPVIGYLNDRFGSRPVLALSTVCVLIPPLIWQFTTPHAYWLNVGLIVVLNLFSGAGWSGVGLGQFNLLLRAAPADARQTYVALLSAATGLVGGIAPILGGVFVTATAGVSFTLGPYLTINNYKLVFLLSTILRAVSLLVLLRVRETDSRSARFVMEQIVSPRSVNSYRALRRLRLPRRESERRATVDTLATLRSPLALDELTSALGDVSRDVRQHAAQALGAIGDPSAAPALIASLGDPAAATGEACADALGMIGARLGTAADHSIIAALARAATGPDGGVRVAAWRALGRFPAAAGDDSPVGPALLAALANTTYSTTGEAACGTLVAWGARHRRGSRPRHAAAPARTSRTAPYRSRSAPRRRPRLDPDRRSRPFRQPRRLRAGRAQADHRAGRRRPRPGSDRAQPPEPRRTTPRRRRGVGAVASARTVRHARTRRQASPGSPRRHGSASGRFLPLPQPARNQPRRSLPAYSRHTTP